MTIPLERRLAVLRSRLQVNWITVAFLAVLLAFVDGFWLTATQGAIGAIERRQSPVTRWSRDSILMLPLFVLAVLAGLLLARHWFAASRLRFVRVGATVLLITLMTSIVGIAEVAASSAYDYRLQTRHLEAGGASHHLFALPVLAGTDVQAGVQPCVGVCAERQLTLSAHVRGVALASKLLLLTNLVLASWVLTLLTDRVWRQQPTSSSRRGEPSNASVLEAAVS